MEQITDFFNNITSLQIIDILIAVAIIIVFRIFSSTISYAIIRMFKIKAKKAKDIRDSAFYKPLRLFFIILGVYLAVLFLKKPLNINNDIMNIITKVFWVISIMSFAIGIAKSFTIQSTLVRKTREKSKRQMDDATLEFILKIVRVVIYIIAVFISLTILGINLNGLIAGLGISGLIVTLAAQDTAKNLFGGVVIFIDKPFAVGDWIQMDAFEGTIEDITFRTTRIRTFENSLVNVPNSIISNASVINWSKMEKRRYKTNLCVEQNTPLDKLEKLQQRIRIMLQQRERVLDDSIIVKFDQITDDGMNILIYTYTDSVSYESYLSEVEDINYKIMKILEEENVKLAYDTKTVYLKQ